MLRHAAGLYVEVGAPVAGAGAAAGKEGAEGRWRRWTSVCIHNLRHLKMFLCVCMVYSNRGVWRKEGSHGGRRAWKVPIHISWILFLVNYYPSGNLVAVEQGVCSDCARPVCVCDATVFGTT